MKPYIFLIAVLIMIILQSCSNEDDIIAPQMEEDWSFQPNSVKRSVTLYVDKDTMNAGSYFDVKVVFYNLDSVFGASMALDYDTSCVKVNRVIIGKYLKSSSDVLNVCMIEQDKERVNVGLSCRSGTDSASGGSGVLLKLKCKALRSGIASFKINVSDLQITDVHGKPINDFDTIAKENASVVIR